MKLKQILTEADFFDFDSTAPEKTDNTSAELEDTLADFALDIKGTDLEPKKVNEALGLTLAGVALSMPELIKLIGKLVNLLKRIPGLSFLSGDQIVSIGDKMHSKLVGAVVFMVKKAGVKDSTKAKKFAEVILHVIIAMLLIAGGIKMSSFAMAGNVKGATLKAALNAIKTKELRSFLISTAGSV